MNNRPYRMCYHYYGPVDNTKTILLTEPVCLWLARMCVGEGGSLCTKEHASLLIATVINRYLLHKYWRAWKDFVVFLRAFSQPINPRWAQGGDLVLKQLKRAKTDKAKQDIQKRIARRERIIKTDWAGVPRGVSDAIEEYRQPGYKEQLAVRTINFASYKGVDKKNKGFWYDGNYFIVDPKMTEEGEVHMFPVYPVMEE